MTTTHRVAIAGIGAVAETHADSLADLDDATLVAGASRTESTGRAFAEEYDCEWFPEVETLLDSTDPDVLIVCTPSGAHLEPTLAAAEHGVDVLCEKPLEITTERIDRMIEAAAEADITLGGVFQQRFKPLFQRFHEAASEGRFGGLSVANAYVPWWRDDEYYEDSWHGTEALDGGGALMNQTIHGVDAAQWLAGTVLGLDGETNPVEEVAAYTATCGHEGLEVEDTAVLSLRYRDGSLGQVLASTAMYPGEKMRVTVGGQDGTVEITDGEPATWEFRDGEKFPTTDGTR